MNRAILFAGILTITTGLQLSRAAIVYDNIGAIPYNQDGYAGFGIQNNIQYEQGMQFTPSETIQLSTLDVVLGLSYFSGYTVTGDAEVQLLTDAGNKYGSVLETWVTATPVSGNGTIFSFTSMATPTLYYGSKYWIVLSDASGSALGGAWYFAETAQPGNVLTAGGATGGTPTYIPRTRGYQSEVIGSIPGDLNDDGVINQADVDIITGNSGKKVTGGIADGDLNGDGVVNLDDWSLFDYDVAEYNLANPSAPVPEPGAMAILGIMSLGMLARRR